MDAMNVGRSSGRPRRQFLADIGKLGVGAALLSMDLNLQAKSPEKRAGKTSRTRRIDVHHHFFPPRFMVQQRARISPGGRIPVSQLLSWTPEKSLEIMDRNGIATAVA